jgi:hypothetical protein
VNHPLQTLLLHLLLILITTITEIIISDISTNFLTRSLNHPFSTTTKPLLTPPPPLFHHHHCHNNNFKTSTTIIILYSTNKTHNINHQFTT